MAALLPAEDLGKLARGEAKDLARGLSRLDDVQVATQLDNLEPDLQDAILAALPEERRAEVIEAMRYESAAEVIRRLSPEDAADILEDVDSEDVADILGRLSKPELRSILERFDDKEDVDEIEELLAYEQTSAGGIMSVDFIAVHDEVTVAEVSRRLQQAEDLPDESFYIYVTDEDDRLVGVVSLRNLVVADPDDEIREAMNTEPVTVLPNTDQEDVAQLASRYDVVAVPVVDEQRRILGIVRIDDIVDVIREEATEDILKMAGAGEALVDTRSFFASFRARFPWLMTAAVGGVLVAMSLSGFEDALRAVPVLALFMPVVAGMGGNVGTQSSTIVVRGLAVGYVEKAKITRLVLRETALGATLGLFYGVVIALCAPLVGRDVGDPLRLGIVLTGGMFGSMTIAALVGSSVPLLLDRFNVDPAVATGPFVTTAVDILGLLFYFSLAAWLLGVNM